MIQRLRRLVSLQMILVAFVALGAIYGIVTPTFEAPDEVWHFAYIKELVDGRGFPLPPIVAGDDTPAQETGQPPLYYVAAALVVRIAAPDTSDRPTLVHRNPAFPYIAEETRNDNKNVFIHVAPEVFPYQGTARAVHLARLVALVFGTLTVAATYGLGREAFPDRPAVAPIAASVVAFTPQFVFISAAASNDSTIAATSALAVWAMVRLLRRGLTVRRALATGGALALAALSKASGAALMPLAVGVLGIAALRPPAPTAEDRAARRARIALAALAVGIVLVAAGPWYLRSLIVFGDWLGTSTHAGTPWVRPVTLSPIAVLSEMPGAVISFWLAFGWGNVLAPDAVYTTLNVLALAGFAGAVAAFARKKVRIERWSLALLAAWLVVIAVILARWVAWLNAPLGRLAFPALSALAVLLAVGWTELVRGPSFSSGPAQRSYAIRLKWLAAVPPLALLALSVMAVPTLLVPAYARPALLAKDQVEQQAGRLADVRYGDVARLIRMDVPRGDWPRPGDEPAVRLCWQALSADPRNLMVLIQLVGEANRVVATRRTLPGLGRFPTSVWQPGDQFCDAVHLPIPKDAPAPAAYHVEVGIIDPATLERLPAYAPDGTRLGSNFVDLIKIAPSVYAAPVIENSLHFRLGNQIELLGYALDPVWIVPGGSARLRLYWRALLPPSADYTVFVHLRAATGQTVTQADGPPQAGAYPTSLWDAGEVVVDDRSIAMPAGSTPGDYAIVVGLYQLSTGERLAVAGGDPANEIVLPAPVSVR